MRSTVALGLAIAATSCTRPEPGGSGQGTAGAPADKSAIAIKGSDTMVILGQRWAEELMRTNPGVSIQVSGGGSGTGIAALINGTTDICQSSRPMKEQEKRDLKQKRGVDAVETKVALDAIAVYVNEKNPVEEITLATLAGIYKGELVSWKQAGGPDWNIVVYGRENNSGTYAYFKEHVLENEDFAQSVQTLAGTSAVVSAVKGDEKGIGYGGIAYLGGVRALKVKKDDGSPATAPSLQTAQDGSYPLARPLFFYTAGPPSGTSKKLIDWVVGEEGQKVIEAVGYYPLPRN